MGVPSRRHFVWEVADGPCDEPLSGCVAGAEEVRSSSVREELGGRDNRQLRSARHAQKDNGDGEPNSGNYNNVIGRRLQYVDIVGRMDGRQVKIPTAVEEGRAVLSHGVSLSSS